MFFSRCLVTLYAIYYCYTLCNALFNYFFITRGKPRKSYFTYLARGKEYALSSLSFVYNVSRY